MDPQGRRGAAHAQRRPRASGSSICATSARPGASASARCRLTVDTGERSGKLVAELENVGKRFGERPILATCLYAIMRGDRIGLLGPNGAGKTTMIKLIVGSSARQREREARHAICRWRISTSCATSSIPNARIAETVSPGVRLGRGRRAAQAHLELPAGFPVHSRTRPLADPQLSGGERNRLLLARLFARPANMLVLDEPTNDLDIEIARTARELLRDYSGTLLLVSHDREFLDNVVTQTIASEGNGALGEYVGGYSDWLRQRSLPRATYGVPRGARRATGRARTAQAQTQFQGTA